MNRFYARVAKRAQRQCEYCHAREKAFNFSFEVEHITPKARGGSDDMSNLALSCISYKGVFETGHDAETETEVALFNPRQNVWDEHFAFASDSGEIVGRTPTGRATIQCLRINSELQISARLLWVSIDYYP